MPFLYAAGGKKPETWSIDMMNINFPTFFKKILYEEHKI